MRLSTTAIVIAALASPAVLASPLSAGAIQTGATVQVKPNSIWFDAASDLARWQKLKAAGDAAALAAYEKDKLGRRDAWQFVNRLPAKVLGYRPGANQVEVKATTKGRFEGLTFFLDADAIER